MPAERVAAMQAAKATQPPLPPITYCADAYEAATGADGVVIATEVRKRLHEGEPLDQAIIEGTTHVVRAVLTTATVAALGFLPMALATGAGSEVQRPLATTVVFGIGASTILNLFLLPALLRLVLRRERRASENMTHL